MRRRPVLRFEAYERGRMPFADEEGREKLLRIDAQKAELKHCVKQTRRGRGSIKRPSERKALIARLVALQAEMVQLECAARREESGRCWKTNGSRRGGRNSQ